MPWLASLVVSSLILLSSISAQAFDFTTSAFGTLTFSGIQTELFQPVGDARNTLLNNQGIGFTFENFPLSIPGTGAANSTLDATQIFTTTSLVGPGLAHAFSFDELWVIPKEIGWSTVTVNYRFEETGTVPFGVSLHAASDILFRGNFNVTGEFESSKDAVETIVTPGQSLEITRITTGTFSRSAYFDTIGGFKEISFHANSRVNAVPIPDTVLPLLWGLVLLALWWERRKNSCL